METKMQICGSEITVKEYNGERVVTLADVDAVHQRVQGTARRNFNENRDKLVEGVDYYKITPYEFRTAIGEMDIRQQNEITLLTESGYLMLVKSLRDDLAWMVQRELVNSYFKLRRVAEAVKQAKEPEDDFTTVCRALQITNKHLQRLQSRNSELECRNEALEAQIERDKPLTEFAKAVQASDDCIYVAELATHLTQHGFPVSEYKLFRLLRELKYLKSVKGAEWNKPAQKGKDLGLFWLNETHREVNGKERVFQTTMVTQKGLRYFLDFFCGKN